MVTVNIVSGGIDACILKGDAKHSRAKQVLLWFSPIRNARKLLLSRSSDELGCVHGIRMVTMAWIIAGHTLEWNNLNTISKSSVLCPTCMFCLLLPENAFDMRHKLAAVEKQAFYKAHYTVETFFYLSGMLTSYVTLKYTRGQYSNFSWFPFLILRYLRLTPQFAVFLLLLSLLPPMFDGPVWLNYVGPVAETCANNWWLNVLYMHNLVDVKYIVSICPSHGRV